MYTGIKSSSISCNHQPWSVHKAVSLWQSLRQLAVSHSDVTLPYLIRLLSAASQIIKYSCAWSLVTHQANNTWRLGYAMCVAYVQRFSTHSQTKKSNILTSIKHPTLEQWINIFTSSNHFQIKLLLFIFLYSYIMWLQIKKINEFEYCGL